MRRALKWAGLGASVIVGFAIFAAIVLYVLGGSRINRHYNVSVAELAIPTDETAVARGRHLAQAVAGCTLCHGENLEGGVLIDEPMIATIYASNLTGGGGGVGATYSDADLVRAIRHGVNRDGRGLMIMHSDAYNNLGAEDLAAIIAYLRSVAPADNEVPKTTPGVLGRILVALGLFDTESMPLIPAEVIDHQAPLVDAPPAGITVEYGRYLVSIGLCAMCHGSNLTGAPPIEEGAPSGPNIVAYGASGPWSDEQFIATIRTGVTPYGKTLDGEVMPWRAYANMTDEELLAIRLYLSSLDG